ncbi:hypothetical protein [Bdellovibrio sp. HCB2-146]|uniref:hypothetical protein n=1 Tax=Bdellovibrio sp. HCB2-146 TaxID=3394362 RepID=UPI0039BD7DAF
MKELVGKILSTLVSSLFVSGVMFIIGLSVITRQFPPDFGQLQSSYESITQLSAMGTAAKSAELEKSVTSAMPEDQDVDTLTAINRKRAEISEGLFHGQGDKVKKEGSIGTAGTQTVVASEDIMSEIRELKTQIFRLQQRVNELETKSAAAPQTTETETTQ